MSGRKLLDKIYFKLVGLDYDRMSFDNHIALDEVVADLKRLRDQVEQQAQARQSGPLPASEAPPVPQTLRARTADTQPMLLPLLRVMILDEDTELQGLMEYALRGEGPIEIIGERSPRVALQQIAKRKPDIILLDVRMKEMSCHDFLTQLRRVDRRRDIEIIIGSDRPNAHEKNAAFEMGAVDYITRPYDMTEVRFKLRLRMEKKKKQCS